MLIGASSSLVFYSIWMASIPLAFFLVALFFTLRLSLLFVGVAIDRKISLRDSYTMTHGPQWALFISLAMFGALFYIFYVLLGIIASWIGPGYWSLILDLLMYPLVSMFAYVLISIVLSILYTETYQPGSNETSATEALL
ncbi:hypothetical protein [Halomonas sp. BC04]|uniref:hypothetical protein n=1 Tax=Halomonas sp. BC04 TaxID=1403540 RepID=UPI0003ED6FFC|nr:hypothetical protein [Halomonas sp. BC04]EWH02473.1 hypothetical protein Q427_08620 [Halomonas sp. BC04]